MMVMRQHKTQDVTETARRPPAAIANGGGSSLPRSRIAVEEERAGGGPNRRQLPSVNYMVSELHSLSIGIGIGNGLDRAAPTFACYALTMSRLPPPTPLSPPPGLAITTNSWQALLLVSVKLFSYFSEWLTYGHVCCSSTPLLPPPPQHACLSLCLLSMSYGALQRKFSVKQIAISSLFRVWSLF